MRIITNYYIKAIQPKLLQWLCLKIQDNQEELDQLSLPEKQAQLAYFDPVVMSLWSYAEIAVQFGKLKFSRRNILVR